MRLKDNDTKIIRWGILGCGKVTEVKSGLAYQKNKRFQSCCSNEKRWK